MSHYQIRGFNGGTVFDVYSDKGPSEVLKVAYKLLCEVCPLSVYRVFEDGIKDLYLCTIAIDPDLNER